MCKFNVPYIQRLTLPMTLGDLTADICDQCGVELGTPTFRNSTKSITNNPFINGEQCREVIKSIAKVSFSVAYINQDNELCFGFDLKTTADEAITTDEYFELEPNKETKPISVIVLRSSLYFTILLDSSFLLSSILEISSQIGIIRLITNLT